MAGGSYFTDNSIWRSNWRCAVIHRTDNAVVSRNVAFDVYGHCYYLEDGVEVGNEVSYNLAARTKIMGPIDSASLETMINAGQEGFTLSAGAGLANPADRAAAGFYITNGNNRIFGNAASGGFAGFSFPNLPAAIGGGAGVVPLSVAISGFDGNSAHTAGYLWREAGSCVYVGGIFAVADDAGTPKWQYKSGRVHAWEELRHELDTFSNTKTFLCNVGLTHWGSRPRVVNMESWDNDLLAKVFGSASIRSTVVAGRSGGGRLVGSGYTDIWRLSDKCGRSETWGVWVCPLSRGDDVAAVNTVPNGGVRVAMYDLDGAVLGQSWYSAQHFLEAQMTGPSGIGWHHAFPGALPEQFEIQAIQVPDESFVLYSFSLPAGAACSIAGWPASASLAALLSSTTATYAAEAKTCFVRIPPTQVGAFEAEDLAIPNQTWRGSPTPTTYFTVVTGCSGSNCQQVVSTIPQMPRRRGR